MTEYEGYVFNLAARIARAVRDGNKPVLEALVTRATTEELCIILEALATAERVSPETDRALQL